MAGQIWKTEEMIMTEKNKHLWIGVCVGRVVPMSRLALAGMRVTRLDGVGHVVLECFLDESVGLDDTADMAWTACHAMTLTLGRAARGGPVSRTPDAMWLEAMGFDENPDSDEFEMAIDLLTGDYCYNETTLNDDGNRVGLAFCLGELAAYIKEKGGHSVG